MVRYLVVGLYVGAACRDLAVWYTKTEFLGIDLPGRSHPGDVAPAHPLGRVRDVEELAGASSPRAA